MSRGTRAALFVALAIRLVPIVGADRVVADVERYEKVATHLLEESWNPYETKRLYPYPPPWAAVEAGALWLEEHGVLRFAVSVKLPVLLADLCIVLLLGRAAGRGRAPAAAAWAYALHPVSILVTGFHGQFDAIALAFVLLAADAQSRGRRDAAALLLGAAIATKSFPVLLLPFLARPPGASWRSALRFTALAAAPVALLLLPFAIVDLGALRRELFGYSGIADFGWTGLWRGLSWLATDALPRSEARFWPTAAVVSKLLFLTAWSALVVAFARRRLDLSPERACLAVMLTFGVFYGAQSAQYLLWPVPLGALRPDRPFVAHGLGGAVGLVGFYLFLAPGVLVPGALGPGEALVAGRVWVLGVAATLAVTALWLAGVVREGRAAARGGAEALS